MGMEVCGGSGGGGGVCVRRGPPFLSENPSKMISVSVGHTCRPRSRGPGVHPVII